MITCILCDRLGFSFDVNNNLCIHVQFFCNVLMNNVAAASTGLDMKSIEMHRHLVHIKCQVYFKLNVDSPSVSGCGTGGVASALLGCSRILLTVLMAASRHSAIKSAPTNPGVRRASCL